MLSKNNYKERLRKMEQKKERFSIRKFSVGAASVLIGFFFMGVGSHTTVHADTVTPQVQTAKENNEATTKAKIEDTSTAVVTSEAASSAASTASSASESANSKATSVASSAAKADSEAASTSDAQKETESIASVENSDNESAAAKEVGESKAASTSSIASSATANANGTGGYTVGGYFVPAPTEPEASQIWKELNSIVKPMSKEALAKLGLDENTYYESANNNTKWHAVGWVYLHNAEGKVINLGTTLYHNQDGTVAPIYDENNLEGTWLYSDIVDALQNANDGNNDFFRYQISQKAYLIPIISDTSTIYINKGSTLLYDDIRRALGSNYENITGLISGNWVTDEQDKGVKVVDVNTPGLQEGVVRLSYNNGTKTTASINVDVVDLQGQTTYVNVNSPVPDADTLISGQPTGSSIKWLTTPDLSKAGVTTGVVQVTYPDSTAQYPSTGTATVTFNVEDPQSKDITVHVGQDVNPKEVVVPNTYPENSTITWVTEPNTNIAGKQNVSVVVTYPNDVSSHEIPAVITVIAPKGQDVTTPNGVEPAAEEGISNVPDMPNGTTYTWKETPEVKTPGTKPATVVVTFPDGNKVDVPVKVTVGDPTPTGKDITTPNGVVPSAEEGISNVSDMPNGTTYTWKETPEVKTPGTKPATVVVTFPDGNKVDVSVKVTVGDPTPTGKDITTPNGKVPSAEEGIGNVPDMPAGTTYTWKETPEVKTPGTKPATVVVTFPDGNKVNVPVKVTVGDPTPTGKDITTPNGKVPSAEQGIGNVPDMPSGTTYTWKDTPEVKTPGTKPAVVVVTFPDGNKVNVPVKVTVGDPTPTGKDITTPNGKVPSAEQGISNVPDMPSGTTYTWKDTPEVKAPGTKPAVVVVTFPDGNKVDVPVKVTVGDPVPQGQDIHTPQGVVPDPSKGISNTPDMPNGTTYTWKDTPDVTTPGNKPAVVVVTYPDGNKVDVPVTVIVDTPSTPQETPVAPKATEPKPQGQDIHTPQGVVPDPSKGISNTPELPGGTKYEWKDTPDVTTPGTHPAVIVVTYPDGKTVEVPVNVIVEPKEQVAPVHSGDVETPKKKTTSTTIKPIGETTTSTETIAPVKSTKVAETTSSSTKKTDYVDSHAKTLPQTGSDNTAAMLGIIIASVSAIIGLAAEKKRRN